VSSPTSSRRLAEALHLDEVTPLRWTSPAKAPPAKRTFGGEVAALAITAAGRSVPDDRHIHSAHMHFLRPGDTTAETVYEVEETRDGGSFTSRRVLARQRDKVIFTLTASFQGDEEGLSHAATMPATPSPEDLPTNEEMFADDEANLRWTRWLLDENGVDARFPEMTSLVAAARGVRTAPRQRVWLRALEPLPDDRRTRDAALAWVSDLLLLSVALGPHGYTFADGRMQLATIDHTIWFHHPIRVDEWFLYSQESRWAGNSRALCHGEIFDRDGRLCATTMQEGLLRQKRPG
jgi:acyl-CoA thioesterase-2